MALFFIIIMLATAGIGVGIRYEDDILHLDHQRASDFTSIEEMLWVKQQTTAVANVPGTLCQAMLKLRYNGGYRFQYIIYVQTRYEPRRLSAFVTTLTTGMTGNRHTHHTVSYKAMQWGQVAVFKLMYADRRHGCFILVSPRGRQGRACRLLQTSRTVNLPIPEDCSRVYAENCPRDISQIYHPSCGASLPKIVEWS
uniref:Licpodalin-4 1 n=1 Tax=Amblyomma maculatum TaxID=34609 RepID=G3MNY5_AMBMU